MRETTTGGSRKSILQELRPVLTLAMVRRKLLQPCRPLFQATLPLGLNPLATLASIISQWDPADMGLPPNHSPTVMGQARRFSLTVMVQARKHRFSPTVMVQARKRRFSPTVMGQARKHNTNPQTNNISLGRMRQLIHRHMRYRGLQ